MSLKTTEAEKTTNLMVKETPLMKQYNQIKVKHPGALLLFRVGDFYETFGEDAVVASRILDIVLTKRSNGSASEIELAGFPHHALDNYLPKLVRAGHRVAICDQLEDPKTVKGIVKRGVTELVTPGLSYHDQVLEKRKNNFLAAVVFGTDQCGIAFLDVSTGEFLTSRGSWNYLENLLQTFLPAEVLYCKTQKSYFLEKVQDKFSAFGLEDWVFHYDFAYEKLTRHFKTQHLKGFGIEDLPEGIIAAGAILQYLEITEHRETEHIAGISRLEAERIVWLDRFTVRNLELLQSQQEGGIPLIEVMDRTKTPMGARLLRKWLVMPLKDLDEIRKRLDTVEAFLQNELLQETLDQMLKEVGDLERLISKVAVGRISPREVVQLKNALKALDPIKSGLSETGMAELQHLALEIDTCDSLFNRINSVLRDDAPVHLHQGKIVRDGVDEELDELRQMAYSGKDYLLKIQKREIERTGISSLKIAYNRVFGYYLEVTNVHKDKVPSDWLRKQTLVNAERYITEELKTYEEKILHAEERLQVVEQRIFQELVQEAAAFAGKIQQNARLIARIDVLNSFAEIAQSFDYVKPKVNDGSEIDIREGRHPVIERALPLGEQYVPNNIFLDRESQQVMIITGPNMAGKSALLRQTALIVLMAQAGCYVPAKRATIGLVDKIFTRVGASDNLARGESTFMVEMTETASILNNLSDRSLILMDEIGRGTSTYDGISIAWSIVEYLHNHPKCRAKTLFATHYHELNQLAEEFPRVKNFNVTVKEAGNKIMFLRKLQPGGSEHSFGIHVAQLAGMPNSIVIRSNEILQHLEKDKIQKKHKQRFREVPKSYQLRLFEADPRFEEVLDLLGKLDINTISPVEALLKLNEVKSILKGAGKI